MHWKFTLSHSKSYKCQLFGFFRNLKGLHLSWNKREKIGYRCKSNTQSFRLPSNKWLNRNAMFAPHTALRSLRSPPPNENPNEIVRLVWIVWIVWHAEHRSCAPRASHRIDDSVCDFCHWPKKKPKTKKSPENAIIRHNMVWTFTESPDLSSHESSFTLSVDHCRRVVNFIFTVLNHNRTT